MARETGSAQRRQQQGLRWLSWTVLAVLVLWAVAWLAVPPLLKWQLETRGSQLLGRELRVGEVQFAPTTLSLTLRELSLGAAPGAPDATPQLQIGRLFVDIDARSLLRWAPVVAGLEMDAPRLRLARLGDGRYDIDDLLQRFAPKPGDPPSEPARFALFNLRMAGGEFSFDDRPVGRTHVLRELHLDLPFLSNLPDDLQVKVEPRLAFELNGAAFDNHGQSTPFAAGRASEFQIRFDALDLSPMWAYVPATLPVQPVGGRLGANLTLRFEQPQGSEPRVELTGRVDLDEFSLKPPGDEPLLAWQRLRLQLADVRPLQRRVLLLTDLQADLLQRRITLGSLSLQKPFIALSRDADGLLDASQWVVVPDSSPSPVRAAAPPWQLALRDFKIDGGRMRLADVALPAGVIEVSAVRAAARGLAWPAKAPLSTQLSATLGVAGKAAGAAPSAASRLNWRGRLSPQPPGASGQLRLERFPVHVFEPYFGAELPVLLQRLEAGFQGQLDLKQLPAGLAGQVRGEALLADLRLLARPPAGAAAADAADRELLTWNAVSIGDFSLSLQPGSKPMLEIGALRITDYYSRLEITEDGRFNLQTVAAPAGDAEAVASSATAAASAASAVQVSAPSAMLGRLPIDLVVNSTRFDNGRVDFRDRFIRPNYSAQLSELNGTVGRLDSRTRDMATLQFSGRVAGTGLLEIGGAVNPTVTPPALDIKAKAHDIELPGLTPYSSKYAGYKIERGKLSVDVAYKIDADGKLEASNQIIVNQLTFGDRTDSPDATNLPVPFIVALLQDRHGVIDLDLPLSGSVNDPQFSLAALIWKVIVNLFTKVVSSPFAVLGGGGKDLSHVEFEPGTALIADSSQEVIDKVAKALDERPRLKLGIVATADPVSEDDAMRRHAFETRLLEERRRERGRTALGSGGTDTALPPLSAEQRARLVKQIYDDTKLPDKPRYLIGMAKDLPTAEMEAMLLAAMPVDAAAAVQLAQQRGRTVREALMAKGLGSERLFIGEPKLRGDAANTSIWIPQAQLTLSAN